MGNVFPFRKVRGDYFETQNRPEVKMLLSFANLPLAMQENPLNLSISFSGGQENNCDSLSNGEWNRDKPMLESRYDGIGVRGIVVQRAKATIYRSDEYSGM